MVHAVNLGGIQKPLQVFAEAENCWSLFRGVTADTFEDTGTVVQHVRHDVDLGVVPVDKLAVVPNKIADASGFNILAVAVFRKHIVYSSRKYRRYRREVPLSLWGAKHVHKWDKSILVTCTEWVFELGTIQ